MIKGFDYRVRAPERLITVEDYRRVARRRLPRMVWNYVDGGADDRQALRDNRDAFSRWVFRPRALTGATEPAMRRRIAGTDLSLPILLSPTGFTGLSYWRGDLAAARAAERYGTRYVLSTASSWSIEEVFGSSPVDHFFQIYPRTGPATAELIQRAKRAGCQVAFVTVDVPVVGNREGERKTGMGRPPTLTPARALNMATRPRWTYDVLRYGRIGGRNLVGQGGLAAALESVDVQTREFIQASLNWDDVAWIRDHWDGPLYLKGILRADDAAHAADLGFDGVVVSNHGGRQLDYAQATLDALPGIAAAVGQRMEILLDGGVRRGTDVVKALALGADAVMIGRPYVYGLAVGGERGASAVLGILAEELERALLLLGVGNIDELGPDLLARRGEPGEQAAALATTPAAV
ncbi:MAG TPA: alpha-hydroxy acid oxidase [Streptosporangiaceae bacterium]|jgi:L-lactate dehydrogenase (cytochrome)/(S)-mandelate dehydrogenase